MKNFKKTTIYDESIETKTSNKTTLLRDVSNETTKNDLCNKCGELPDNGVNCDNKGCEHFALN